MGFKPGWEWVVLVLIVLVLFGYKRLPDAARGLGRSLRIFKSEVSELKDDPKTERTSAEQVGKPLPPATEQAPPADPTGTGAEHSAESPRNDR
jgi:sec-independent protein translocase protein TatA